MWRRLSAVVAHDKAGFLFFYGGSAKRRGGMVSPNKEASDLAPEASVLVLRLLTLRCVTEEDGSTLLAYPDQNRSQATFCSWNRPRRREAARAQCSLNRLVDAIGCSMAVWPRFLASKTVTCGFGYFFFISFAAFSTASYVPNPDFSCRLTAI